MTFVAFPFVVYFSFAFQNGYKSYVQIVMGIQHDADALAEECLRNIRTVQSLGAEKSFIDRFYALVKNCCKQAIIAGCKSSLNYSGMNISSQIANGLLFLSAAIIVNSQRSSYLSRLELVV